jgi:hypothetical protein
VEVGNDAVRHGLNRFQAGHTIAALPGDS